MQRRVLAVAVAAAVVAATGGTALAAGELITRGDQIAPDVIDGSHIKRTASPGPTSSTRP